MDDQAGIDAVERRGALVGNQAQEAHRDRQGDRRRGADVAAALEAIEDAGAEIAPRLVDAGAALQAHRRDVRAGVEREVDVDQRQDAAEIEVEGAARGRIGGVRPAGSALAAKLSSRAESTATSWRSATSTLAPVRSGADGGSAQTRRTKRPGESGRPTTGCASVPDDDCKAITWPLPAPRHWRRSSLVSSR